MRTNSHEPNKYRNRGDRGRKQIHVKGPIIALRQSHYFTTTNISGENMYLTRVKIHATVKRETFLYTRRQYSELFIYRLMFPINIKYHALFIMAIFII